MIVYTHMAVKAVPCEPFPTDALVRPVRVLAFGHGVTVVEIKQAFVVVGAAVFKLALQGVAVVSEALEGADGVLALAIPV